MKLIDFRKGFQIGSGLPTLEIDVICESSGSKKVRTFTIVDNGICFRNER